MSEKSDTPETPPDVIARQAKSRALTRETADLIKSPDYIDDGGRTQPMRLDSVTLADMSARKARTRAEAYVGGTPVAGLKPDEVARIKNLSYENAPEMDVELGDRTVAFVNWLYANYPADAKVRYAYRDIWPTVLPTNWPKVEVKKIVGPTLAEDPLAELERLRAENAALKRVKTAKLVDAKPKKAVAVRKVASRAKPEVSVPSAPSTSASS